jgi:uncharacterized protein YbaR (Trm112 family)
MIANDLISILRCPEDHSALTRAEPALVAAINRRIAARQVQSRGGRTIEQPLDEGLVRAGGDVLYPVVEGIPRMLIEEGILLAQFDLAIAGERGE